MTDFYGVNATKRDNSVPSQKIAPGEVNGRVRMAYDEYTFTAVIETTDSLKMMEIPEGARVLEVYIKSDDLGTAGDINVGWEAGATATEAADPDGFFAALDVNAAPIGVTMTATDGTVAGFMKKFEEKVRVVIVPTENTTATSGTIKLAVTYVVD